MFAPPIPQVTLDEYERHPLHSVCAAIDKWAAERPDDYAIINATRGTTLTWSELQRSSRAVAAGLSRMGFSKGDRLAASLPMLDEHILLEFGCFRLGVIHAPLDLRLDATEVLRCLSLLRPKAYAFPGKIGAADFGALGEVARARCGSIEHLIQFAPRGDRIARAVGFENVVDTAAGGLSTDVSEHDPAQVIFTTGSTGSPKPALLSHRGITCQNFCLASGFSFGPGERVLVNLPASHVGGQAELLMTTLFSGATAVTLEVFDPVKSLDAVERHGVTLIGQIPAMFQMEWRTANYAGRSFPSLTRAVYGGQSAPQAFLEQMRRMAPRIATGLGLTECSGFCTYTAVSPDIDEVARGIGWAMPAYPLSIRGPMNGDGPAGAEVAAGEIGHVCFRGPQTFLGYLGDPEATAAAISSDGWLYTGDMGRYDEGGLKLSGRAKWVLKVAGYQVFPGDVEAHFAALADKVANVGVVGQPHPIWGEAIIAFVEKRPGADLTEAELRKYARSLTSYMRPLHYAILEAGAMPLNRSAKVDMVRLQAMAKEESRKLPERGRWDAGE